MGPKPIILENGNQFTDFSANKNGFVDASKSNP
jgi:hypothetical protein